MSNFKGLYALLLIAFLNSSLLAKYLYKDEVVQNTKFSQELELLGEELFRKTGVNLQLMMLKELPTNTTMVAYEREQLKTFHSPTILLSFSQKETKIDILANDEALYKYFNKKKVLSPAASYAQAIMLGIFYAKNWDEFQDLFRNAGGSILPLIGDKTKKNKDEIGKYSASMYNGYLDIAMQIAKSKNVTLSHAPSSTGATIILFIKILFYGFIIYAIIMYIRRKMYIKRSKV